MEDAYKAALAAELAGSHPTSGAYNADDALATDQINLADIVAQRATMTGSEIFAATESAEYTALTDAKKAQWLSFCSVPEVDPYGPAVQVVTDIWGGGSTTVSNLQAARTETISRAQQLGFGTVIIGDVQNARA